MRLNRFYSDPQESFVYSERYLNTGSPSGFSSINEVSPRFQPIDGDRSFLLPFIKLRDVTKVGKVPKGMPEGVPTHPDLISAPGTLEVIPTSSTRTVFVPSQTNCIKLHYPKAIGRAPRIITLKEINRAVHLTNILSNKKDLRFGYLPENGGVYSPSLGYGAIFRELGEYLSENRGLVPAFALFSRDNSQDPTLLEQLLRDSENYDLLLESLVGFSVDSFKNKLLFEAHSQNVLLELLPKGKIGRVVVRDFGDCYVDGEDEVSMTLNKLNSDEQRRFRSVLYDQKFGKYLLSKFEDIIGEQFRRDYVTLFRHEMNKSGEYERFMASLPQEKTYSYPSSRNTREDGKPIMIEGGFVKFR